jgi:hypothetical protein
MPACVTNWNCCLPLRKRNFSLRASASRQGKQLVADLYTAIDDRDIDIFNMCRRVFNFVPFLSKLFVIDDQLPG